MIKHIAILLLTAVLFEQSYSQSVKDTTYFTTEIEVTSFFNNVKRTDSPSNIYILEKEKIQSVNGRNTGNVLGTVPGVFVKNYGSGGALQTISMNGLNAEHTIILLNGSKLNSMQNAQIDLSLIPKENIKKIEVLNNGFSSVYGSDAIGGVINIITDDFYDGNKLNINLKSGYGSNNTRYVSLKAGSRIDNFRWSIQLSDEKSDNDFDYYYDKGEYRELKTRQNAGYLIGNFVLTGDYIPSDKIKFYIYSQFVNSEKDVPGIETGNIPPDTKQTDRNWNNIITIKYSGNYYSFENELNYQNNLMNYRTEPYINSFYKNLLFSNSSRINYEVLGQSISSGIEIKYGKINSNELNENVNRKQISLYNSVNLDFGNFRIFPSFRFDYISDIDKGVYTYKAGFNYKIFEKHNLNIRGNVSSNFSAPTFNALYWKTGGNKNLKPETSNNIEIGVIYSGGRKLSYNFSSSLLYINAENRIVWISGKNLIWNPVNLLTSKSVISVTGFNIEYNITNDFKINAELSYIHNNSEKTSRDFPDDPTEGKQIIYIPVEQVKSCVGIQYKSSGINLFYTYTGKRFSDAENLLPVPVSSVIDGNLYFDFDVKNISATIKLEINNITNTNYWIISGYPLPLRNYMLNIQIYY